MINGINIGVQLFTLRKYLKTASGFWRVFENLKKMECETVQVTFHSEPQITFEELAKVSKEFNMPICQTHCPFQMIKNELDRLIDAHKEINCKNIGISMMPNEYRKNSETVEQFIAFLNETAEKLKEHDLRISYHNHWFEFNVMDDGKVMFDKLIEETVKEVFFIPDTYWIQIGKEDPVEYLKRFKNRVSTLHLKDYKKFLGTPLFRAVGKGTQDYAAIMNVAKEIGVEDAVVELDLSPRPYKSVEFSLEYLKNLKT